MTSTFMLRGDTAANWTGADPVLHNREPGLETDTLKWKVGDGSTSWTGLPYFGGGGGGGIDFGVANSGTYLDIETTADDGSQGIYLHDTAVTGSPGINLTSDAGYVFAEGNSYSGFGSGGNEVYAAYTTGVFLVVAGSMVCETTLGAGSVFRVKDSGGNPMLSTTEGVGGIATAPPVSSASTLALGTAYQNTLGYDILLAVNVNITVNAAGSVLLGVGPTSTPTQQTIESGITALGPLMVPIYLPNNYYALLSASGLTASIVGQIAMPV